MDFINIIIFIVLICIIVQLIAAIIDIIGQIKECKVVDIRDIIFLASLVVGGAFFIFVILRRLTWMEAGNLIR